MIRQATMKDALTVAKLAVKLWPSHTIEEMTAEFEHLLADTSVAVFLFYIDRNAIGFAQCQLRNDYVEGTDSSPVGYLEGIYIADHFRKQGFGKMLLGACEQWAKEQRCKEFASDCELDNTQSLSFHLHSGFDEANRIICFVKRL